jgi:pimeloyl-ACP methyl ester carboxylesterase
MGSGAAVDASSRYPSLLGLVLECPLASCYWIMNIEEAENTINDGNMYDSYNKMRISYGFIQAKIKCPILLLHGKLDKCIPYRHSEILYER